jgi:hypothetical protein
MIGYLYRTGARAYSKQPDASFIPLNIQIPPAKAQPGTTRPGFGGVAFPTVVFEIAHKHEAWHLLLRDAREKAFSNSTSVQIFVGVKLFKNAFKVFWARRDNRRGRGMKIMRMTEKLSLNHPTRKFLLLPTHLIYLGCPNTPAHLGPHFRLSLEQYRQWITSRGGV